MDRPSPWPPRSSQLLDSVSFALESTRVSPAVGHLLLLDSVLAYCEVNFNIVEFVFCKEGAVAASKCWCWGRVWWRQGSQCPLTLICHGKQNPIVGAHFIKNSITFLQILSNVWFRHMLGLIEFCFALQKRKCCENGLSLVWQKRQKAFGVVPINGWLLFTISTTKKSTMLSLFCENLLEAFTRIIIHKKINNRVNFQVFPQNRL